MIRNVVMVCAARSVVKMRMTPIVVEKTRDVVVANVATRNVVMISPHHIAVMAEMANTVVAETAVILVIPVVLTTVVRLNNQCVAIPAVPQIVSAVQMVVVVPYRVYVSLESAVPLNEYALESAVKRGGYALMESAVIRLISGVGVQ
jgi:hypothetical protein